MKTDRIGQIRRNGKILTALLALGLGLLAVAAFADVHDIQVNSDTSNGNGAHWQNGTIYNVPTGAEVDWSMSFSGSSGGGQIIFGGCGFDVNVSGGQNFWNYGLTTSSGDISYQVSAQSSYPDSATSELVVAW